MQQYLSGRAAACWHRIVPCIVGAAVSCKIHNRARQFKTSIFFFDLI